eukprot:1290337-Rhodomonas_salina.2
MPGKGRSLGDRTPDEELLMGDGSRSRWGRMRDRVEEPELSGWRPAGLRGLGLSGDAAPQLGPMMEYTSNLNGTHLVQRRSTRLSASKSNHVPRYSEDRTVAFRLGPGRINSTIT